MQGFQYVSSITGFGRRIESRFIHGYMVTASTPSQSNHTTKAELPYRVYDIIAYLQIK